jgi:adenylate cyclase
VGREKEMEKLERALASAMQGQGQIVAVVGEAGIGKSRLCIEFAERCRAQGIEVHGARCVPYGRAVPLSPVMEFLQGYFGVDADDDPEVARKKITGALVCEDERVRDSLPLLFDFLGVPDPEHPVSDMDAESRHRLFVQTLDVCTKCHKAPTVVLFENLQWVDGGTEVFLEQLADTLPGNPALLLVNYRPDYDPHWFRGRTHDQLRLLPLGDEAVAELLTDVLGTDPGVRALADRIRERAGGNPFFVEEVAQALAEAGTLAGERGAYRLAKPVDELAIPPTVHGVVAERIDGLNEQQKEVLQTAAVIGRRFSQPLLQKVIDLPEAELTRALRALESSEFIDSVRLYPTAEYAFRQGLTQEVSYRAQLTDRRARIHASVARALEAEKCEKLDECATLLAHHWEQAGDALRAARWSLEAGEWTAVRDPTVTLDHYRKAAFLLESVPESPETLELAVAARAGVLRSAAFLSVSQTELARVFEEGKALARRARDQAGLVRLFGAYGAAQASQGSADSALENAKEAVRLAREMDYPEFEASLRAMIMFAYYGAGRLREALDYSEESQRRLAGGRSPADEEVTPENSISRGMRALMLVHMGSYEEAARDLERAIQLGLDQGKTYSWMHGALVDLAFFTRLSESPMHHARAAIASAEGFGSPFFMASAFRALGHAHVFEEQWPEAIAAYEHALGIIRETRTAVQLEAVVLALLAEAQLGAGDGQRARKSAEEAVEVARNHHTRLWECQARLALVQALLSTEGTQASAEIDEELARASALIEETGARGYLPLRPSSRSSAETTPSGSENSARRSVSSPRWARRCPRSGSPKSSSEIGLESGWARAAPTGSSRGQRCRRRSPSAVVGIRKRVQMGGGLREAISTAGRARGSARPTPSRTSTRAIARGSPDTSTG